MQHKTNRADTILSLICMLIFLFSALMMLTLGSNDSQYLFLNNFQYLILYVIPVWVLMELSFKLNDKAGRIIRWGMPVVFAIGVCVYLFKTNNLEMITYQMNRIVQNYIMEWDMHYQGTVYNIAGSEIYDVNSAIVLVMVISFFVVTWIALLTRKNVVMGIIPFSVMILEHLVGVSPNNISVILLFAGVLLSNAAGWKKVEFIPVKAEKAIASYMWLLCGAFVILLYIVISVIGSPSDEEIDRRCEEMKLVRNKVVEVVTGIDYEKAVFGEDVEAPEGDGVGEGEGDSLGGLIVDGKVTNETPEYEEKTVMTVTLDKRPKNNVYLKGMHARVFDYEEYEFNNDTVNDIKTDLLMSGYSVDSVYEKIISYAQDTFMRNSNNEKVSEYIQLLNGKIDYKVQQNDVLYLPYFVETVGAPAEPKSDVLYVKAEGVDKITSAPMAIWDIDPDYSKWVKNMEKDFKEEWEFWYELQSYKGALYNLVWQLCDDRGETIVDSMWANVENSKRYNKNGNLLVDTKFKENQAGQIVDSRYDNILNDQRLILANEVKEWLATNKKYSLVLDEEADDDNPIGYFITDGDKGYCVHFASAATGLLNSMGVCARYVTGFVATVDKFVEKNGAYEATVLDSDAHAWVEIYLNGIGWVPFEVTGGYSVDERPEPKAAPTPTNTPSKASPTVTPAAKKGGIYKVGSILRGIFKYSGMVIVIVFAVMIIAALVLYILGRSKSRNKLVQAVKRKRTLYAVRSINRRLYKKLRVRGKILKMSPRDDVFEEILKKTFTSVAESEWERYMCIAKAATFSCGIITEEEMEFCYEIYKKCC